MRQFTQTSGYINCVRSNDKKKTRQKLRFMDTDKNSFKIEI